MVILPKRAQGKLLLAHDAGKRRSDIIRVRIICMRIICMRIIRARTIGTRIIRMRTMQARVYRARPRGDTTTPSPPLPIHPPQKELDTF